MDVAAITAAIESHLMTLGQFDHVAFHEPKNAPGNNLTAAVMLGPGGPVPEGSGQAATTARVSFTIRIYNNMLEEPQDGIDKNLLRALDAVINAYHGDYTLGATVMAVDLLGMAGEPLSWQPGYLNQDNTLYRVIDITLPLMVADAWTQAA